MDLEFEQKSSKLKAQSEWVWFQSCSLGVSSVLVQITQVVLFMKAALGAKV